MSNFNLYTLNMCSLFCISIISQVYLNKVGVLLLILLLGSRTGQWEAKKGWERALPSAFAKVI